MTDLTPEQRTPPKAAQKAAQQVLRWRDEHGDEVQGMTEVGWRRASQIAKGEPISIDEIKEIAQFARHEKNSEVNEEYKGEPWKDAGRVAWLGWGGDSAVLEWAPRIVEKSDEKKNCIKGAIKAYCQLTNSEFKESEHPRDDDGKFTSGSSKSTTKEKKGKIDFGGGSYIKKPQAVEPLERNKEFMEKALKSIKDEGREAPLLEKQIQDLQEKIDKESNKSEKKISLKPFPKEIKKVGGSYEKFAENVAEKIEKLSGGQITAYADRSGQSESAYIQLTEDDTGKGYKIRISDHEDRHGGNDFNFSPEEDVHSYFYKKLESMLRDMGADNFGNIFPEYEKKNAKEMPGVFYCRHMYAGLAGYEKETILIALDSMKRLAKTFPGKPVYVYHQDVDLDQIENADGFVSDCWYDARDGWLWAKFVAVSDAARKAIRDGWSVSNAYIPTDKAGGGTYTNLPYKWEVLDGNFTHLALVPNPRYESAMILDKDSYLDYSSSLDRQAELKNSKEKKKGFMMKFWKNKKEEVENPDFDTMVTLTNDDGTERDVSVREMVKAITNAESKEEDKKEEKMNMDMEVEVGEDKMPLKELINKYMNMCKKNADDEKEKMNMDGEDDEDDKEEEKSNSKEGKKHFEELKNAHKSAGAMKFETSLDMVRRGKQRYGSGK